MEVWKEFVKNYEISNYGRVKSLGRIVKRKGKIIVIEDKIMKQGSNGKYPTILVRYNNKTITRLIHRLVAQAFVNNPNNYQEVNHIDGDKLNNVSTNLEWVTRSGNVQHAVKNKLMGIGEDSPISKLSNEDVIKIRELRGQYTCAVIGKMFGVCAQYVSAIQNHKKRLHEN